MSARSAQRSAPTRDSSLSIRTPVSGPAPVWRRARTRPVTSTGRNHLRSRRCPLPATPQMPVPQQKGTVGKCVYCADLLPNGELPACVSGCPMGVIYIGDLVTCLLYTSDAADDL